MFNQKKILLVDDEKSILEMLEILLVSEGYIVFKAINGEEGVTLAKKHKPDVIILDVKMPKMSGYMVASILGEDPDLSHIPILLLTAVAQMAGNITIEQPTDYRLIKPFKPE